MKPDGGPAFPHRSSYAGETKFDGMSLRDWFAGQAISGMLASAPVFDRSPENTKHDGWAMNAYLFADAMLKEREK